MAEKNNIPFPQANNFDNILKIVLIDDENNLKNNDFLKELLDLGTDRQISYYLSACEFLGLLQRRNLTLLGKEIRNLPKDIQILKLSQLIVSSPVFGEVFFMKYFSGKQLSKDEISELISIIYGIDSDEVCGRRASTVSKWLEWIEKNKENIMTLS